MPDMHFQNGKGYDHESSWKANEQQNVLYLRNG